MALDPNNKEKPLNLTINGRELSASYRLVELDKTPRGRFGGASNEGIDVKKAAFLTAHNEITREDGYYSTSLKKAAKPKKIIGGKYKLGRPIKAKDADLVVYTKEDFKTYPNLLATGLKFKKSQQISDAAPQQKDFYWGDVELVNWTSLDGRKLQGTLHMPEDFDPNKKYPLIVNFYEKNSQGLYNYRMPEAHRSTVDYHYYTSNGYIIFNPDIYYKTGYPGEDAFNCVMPGITSLIEKGFVEEVRYDKDLVTLMNSRVKKISFWVLLLSAIFTLIAVLLINSSIRLAVYSKRFTIKTMQMVGATKQFIRRPFVWKSVRLGIIGAVLALIGMAIVLFYLNKTFTELELDLPGSTRFIIATSDAFKNNTFLMILFLKRVYNSIPSANT